MVNNEWNTSHVTADIINNSHCPFALTPPNMHAYIQHGHAAQVLRMPALWTVWKYISTICMVEPKSTHRCTWPLPWRWYHLLSPARSDLSHLLQTGWYGTRFPALDYLRKIAPEDAGREARNRMIKMFSIVVEVNHVSVGFGLGWDQKKREDQQVGVGGRWARW